MYANEIRHSYNMNRDNILEKLAYIKGRICMHNSNNCAKTVTDVECMMCISAKLDEIIMFMGG
jgi:hypothetical protein